MTWVILGHTFEVGLTVMCKCTLIVLSSLCRSCYLLWADNLWLSTDHRPNIYLSIIKSMVHTKNYSLLKLLIVFLANLMTIISWLKRWTFGVIINATVSVDSFFVLSAFLTTYLFLRDMEKRKPGIIKFLISVPIMYLHRYLR